MGIDDESSHPELCSEVAGSVTRTIVCLFREPDAGNPPVRFDEREEETELCQTGLRRRGESPANRHREANVTAPLLDSTRVSDNVGGVKNFLSTLLYPLEEERHFALAEKQLPVPTKARS